MNDQELTSGNVMRALKDGERTGEFSAAKAGKLGLGLGVSDGKIQQFKMENPGDLEGMLNEVISHWLRSDEDTSWDKLAEALRFCDCNNLANKIQGKKPTKSADDGVRKRTVQSSNVEDTGRKLARNAIKSAVEREQGGTNRYLMVALVVVAILGGLTFFFVYSGEARTDHRTNRDHTDASTSSEGCTEIRSSGDLEKVLEELDIPHGKMCRDLGIQDSTCKTLERNKDLRVDTMAPKYLEERERSCWEDIVAFLCPKHRKKALKVKNTHGMSDKSYSKYCI